MLNAALFWKLVRFGVVGVTVMIVFMGLNWWLSPILGRQVGFIVAYVPAVALHFCLNKFWTFGCGRTDSARQVSEYIFMVIVTFLIQWSVFTALGAISSWPSWLNAGIANVAQMAVSFLMMQRRVFSSATANKVSL